MRLIDADAYEIEINQRLNDCMTLKIDAQNFDSFLLADGALIAYSQTKMVLDDMPTVDAVEVVLCKDCKHSDWYTKNGQHRCYCMENQVNGFTENDYCSRGERSE